MPIEAYKGISDSEINATRLCSNGKPYTLAHNESLIVGMKYRGVDKSTSNAQGWERSSSKYFNEVQSKHPEFFSQKNTVRIKNGEAPIVDAKFIQHFPEYSSYKGERLAHHHIGGDGQAVAVPESVHKGSGEIHNIEKDIGVTANAKAYSEQCRHLCEKDGSYIGKTTYELGEAQKNAANPQQNTAAQSTSSSQSPSRTPAPSKADSPQASPHGSQASQPAKPSAVTEATSHSQFTESSQHNAITDAHSSSPSQSSDSNAITSATSHSDSHSDSNSNSNSNSHSGSHGK